MAGVTIAPELGCCKWPTQLIALVLFYNSFVGSGVPARLVCLFAILISMLLGVQCSRAPLAHQSSPLSIAREMHPRATPSFSRMLQGLSFAQHDASAFNATLPQRQNLAMSGSLFALSVAYGSGGFEAQSVAVADVNEDGKLDLLVANACTSGINRDCTSSNSDVGVLLGNGDGTFQTAVTYDSGGVGPRSVAVADVNGDGKLDLLVPGVVMLGNGDGAFQSAVTYDSGGVGPRSVAVADVNGDGKPDLLVANDCCVAGVPSFGTVGVLLGNGDGTFQTALTYSSGGVRPQSVAMADVNGDSKPDLLVANACGDPDCAAEAPVIVLLGNGDGTFQTDGIFQTAIAFGSGGSMSRSVAAADVNGDGKPDLLMANSCTSVGSPNGCTNNNGTVGVLLGNGDGTFQTVPVVNGGVTFHGAVTYGSGGFEAQSVAVADVNEDDKPDLLVANSCNDLACIGETPVGVLLGNGDGTFQTVMVFGSGGQISSSVTAADVNRDGKPELLVANACTSSNCNGAVGVLINQTVPNFQLRANPDSITITAPGKSGSTTIRVTTYGGLSPGSLTNWICSGLPAESSCTFGSIGSNNQVSLSITTMAANDLRRPLFEHHQHLFYAMLLPGFLGVVSVAGRRLTLRGLQLLALSVLLGLTVLWVACGSNSSHSSHGTPAGSNTIIVSATSGTLQRSTSIALTVQ